MIKDDKGKIEIEGDVFGIITEMAEIILAVKEEVKSSDVFSQLIDLTLLKCTGAENKLEFLTDKKILLEKVKNKIAKLEELGKREINND